MLGGEAECTKALGCDKVCGAWGTAISLVSLGLSVRWKCPASVMPVVAATGGSGS